MKDDCCCEPAGKPSPGSPSITGGGNPPLPNDTGPAIAILAGSSGIENGTGNPIAKFFKPGPNGEFVMKGFLVPQAAIDDLSLGSDPYTPTINQILAVLRAIGAIEN